MRRVSVLSFFLPSDDFKESDAAVARARHGERRREERKTREGREECRSGYNLICTVNRRLFLFFSPWWNFVSRFYGHQHPQTIEVLNHRVPYAIVRKEATFTKVNCENAWTLLYSQVSRKLWWREDCVCSHSYRTLPETRNRCEPPTRGLYTRKVLSVKSIIHIFSCRMRVIVGAYSHSSCCLLGIKYPLSRNVRQHNF